MELFQSAGCVGLAVPHEDAIQDTVTVEEDRLQVWLMRA